MGSVMISGATHWGPKGAKTLAVHLGWMETEMGAAANIHPDEAAEGVYQLATRKWDLDGVIYLDYRGRPLPW